MSDTVANGQGSNDALQYLSHLKAGEYVFRESEPGSEMFIIQHGQVEIVKLVRGAERRVALLEEGDFFGEMAILEDLPRSASARAVTECSLLRIDSATFDQMVRHHPEIPVRMLRKLSSRLRDADLHTAVDEAPASLERDAMVSVAAEKPPSPRVKPPTARVKIAAKPVAPSPPEVPPSPPEVPPSPPVEPDARPAPPAAAEPPATPGRPRFVHLPSGAEFPLADGSETFVGRFDATTGFQPEIDLRAADTDRSTSRRHARVVRRDDGWSLREEIGTANGTFVNGTRIGTGIDIVLHDGDTVTFGRVAMVFHAS